MLPKKSFFQRFLKEKKMVGAISPSSSFLTNKMLENIDFHSAKVFIEIGPGTGVFTKKMLSRMNPESLFLVFELNTEFHQELQTNIVDERVVLINDSAEKLEDYLVQYNIPKVDVIISSLPLSNFYQRFTLKILRTFKDCLNESGKFIQFQYSLKQKKELNHVFSNVDISFTLLNIPPAFVYTCSK
jgi:phosphatidylethanolamine/phosphatidyl-N-methylethanolamine N-methyltransferase